MLSFCEAPLRFSASPVSIGHTGLAFFLEGARVEADGLGNLSGRRYDEGMALP